MKILFDIGGSKIRISSTEDGEKFSEPIIHDTPVSVEEGAELFCETALAIADGEKIEGMWGGITGVWDKKMEGLVYSPNMSGWVDKPIRRIFEDKLSAPLVVGNDSDVVGLGEVHYGAGVGSEICSYITISTGVGGARIVDGLIDRATVGFEPGHHIINHSLINKEKALAYKLDVTPASTFEDHVSGTALNKTTGMDPRDVVDAEIWERLAFESAIGVFNSILFWSPDTVVIGGSMVVGDPAIPIDRIRHHVEKFANFLPHIPEIKKAELGAIGGIYGALVLSKQFPV